MAPSTTLAGDASPPAAMSPSPLFAAPIHDDDHHHPYYANALRHEQQQRSRRLSRNEAAVVVESTQSSSSSSSSWRGVAGGLPLLLMGAAMGYVACLFAQPSSYNKTAAATVMMQLGGGGGEAHQQRLLSHGEEEVGDEAMEEEGEEEEEGESNDEWMEELAISSSITIIIVVLILLTIAFEHAKEHMEESADRIMRPIIESLFGEMTVLGFLSVSTFVVTQMGFFEQLSIRIFGEEEKEELLEIFEQVHYFLFFIMVFFVSLVLLLVKEAMTIEEEWLAMDQACRDENYMTTLFKLKKESLIQASSPSSIGAGGWFQRALRRVLPKIRTASNDTIDDQLVFHGLRHEFLLERSVEPPTFDPATAEHRVGDDFNFGRYLSVCLAHTLSHVVHVRTETWAFFGLLTVMFFGVMIAVEDELVVLGWIWVGLGWVLFLFNNAFEHHLVEIVQSFAASPFLAEISAAAEGGGGNDPEKKSLLVNTTDQSNIGGGGSGSGNEPYHPLPAWCHVDLTKYLQGRHWFAKMLYPHAKPNRQDTLYWAERKGPRFITLVFQIKLVFTAVYGALLLLTFFPAMYGYYAPGGFLAYLILALGPIVVLRRHKRHLAATMAQACSLGPHRRPQVVAQVLREEKTARIVRAFVVLYKMQRAAESGFQKKKPKHEAGPQEVDPVDLANVSKTFDAFDGDGSGTIASSEFHDIMIKLGAPLTDDGLHAMVKVLDADGNGDVSKEEFLNFYKEHILAEEEGEELSLHEQAHFMFSMFDKDKSGEITIGEFKSTIDAFNVGFSVDEIGDLVNELDEQDNGTVSDEEFEELLEKYERLLKKYKPKPPTSYRDVHHQLV